MKINWVTLLFITLTDRSLRLRQKLWRGLYNKIVSRDKLGKFLFMNYGYENQYSNQSLCLKPEDEPFRYFIQLYHFVVQSLELQNKDVMEVGSGRGGGGSFIIRYKKTSFFHWCGFV